MIILRMFAHSRPAFARPKTLLASRSFPFAAVSKQRRMMSTPNVASAIEHIGHDCLVDEETLPNYDPEHYYPVKLGEIFGDRYRTVGKLGFGSASTVWLCKDLRTIDEYVALKVYINRSKIHRELPIYKHINEVQSSHPGKAHIRKLLNSFEITGPHGKHMCLVHQPLGMSFEQLKDLAGDEGWPTEMIRAMFRDVWLGLKYLHQEAGIIHTDLQPNNLLLGVNDNSLFAEYEQQQIDHPVPRKILDDRTIYTSRFLGWSDGRPAISDLSEARFANCTNTDLIMPDVYRAPEVILGLPWSYSVDQWAFAMVIWDLFQPQRLFTPKDDQGNYSEAHHLAQMIAILGSPPLDLLQQSQHAGKYWTEDGAWRGMAPIPHITLEHLEQRLEGEEKRQFLRFIQKVLHWRPGDRSDWEDVFMDEWLLADLIEEGKVSLPKD